MSVVDLLHILIWDRQVVIDRRRVIRNLHENKRLASASITIPYSDPNHAKEELSDNRRNEAHRVETNSHFHLGQSHHRPAQSHGGQ
jgi:hypothetical protein